jgi:hypothetical protein
VNDKNANANADSIVSCIAQAAQERWAADEEGEQQGGDRDAKVLGRTTEEACPEGGHMIECLRIEGDCEVEGLSDEEDEQAGLG